MVDGSFPDFGQLPPGDGCFSDFYFMGNMLKSPMPDLQSTIWFLHAFLWHGPRQSDAK